MTTDQIREDFFFRYIFHFKCGRLTLQIIFNAVSKTNGKRGETKNNKITPQLIILFKESIRIFEIVCKRSI